MPNGAGESVSMKKSSEASSASSSRPAKKTRTSSRFPVEGRRNETESPSARARILAGARAVFEERGVRPASVEDILKKSSVSRRTFYQYYSDKEDVAADLYRIGTDALLNACEHAVASKSVPAHMVAGCIDAHLHNARTFGRLVFVLGGEAQRQESRLHARRMEVHEKIVSLVVFAASRIGHDVDPILVRALVLALEGTTRLVLEAGNEGRSVSKAKLEAVRRVMTRLASRAL